VEADYRYLYIFVRKDLDYSQIVVQACHATLEATRGFIKDASRYKIVCLGVRNAAKLEKVIEELEQHKFGYVVFSEPALGWEKTAIATEPLTDKQKVVFSRYKLLQKEV